MPKILMPTKISFHTNKNFSWPKIIHLKKSMSHQNFTMTNNNKIPMFKITVKNFPTCPKWPSKKFLHVQNHNKKSLHFQSHNHKKKFPWSNITYPTKFFHSQNFMPTKFFHIRKNFPGPQIYPYSYPQNFAMIMK